MSPLSDIDAHCEKHTSMTDSAHETVDRVSSQGDGSKGPPSPNVPGNQAPCALAPRGPNPVVIAVVIIVLAALIIVPILVLVGFPHEGSPEGSPTGVYEEYVDAVNDRDTKRAFDQTVTQFVPGYELMLDSLGDRIYLWNPEIDILSVGMTYQADMNNISKIAAQVIVADVEDVLSVEIDDFCYVTYTISVYYQDLNQTVTIPGEVLCVEIDGQWYMAMPSFY